MVNPPWRDRCLALEFTQERVLVHVLRVCLVRLGWTGTLKRELTCDPPEFTLQRVVAFLLDSPIHGCNLPPLFPLSPTPSNSPRPLEFTF